MRNIEVRNLEKRIDYSIRTKTYIARNCKTLEGINGLTRLKIKRMVKKQLFPGITFLNMIF